MPFPLSLILIWINIYVAILAYSIPHIGNNPDYGRTSSSGSGGIYAKEFQELRAENAKIKADFQALQTSIAALPAQLLDGTLAALRSPSSPMYEMQQMMMGFIPLRPPRRRHRTGQIDFV
jgi:hypothetical protein